MIARVEESGLLLLSIERGEKCPVVLAGRGRVVLLHLMRSTRPLGWWVRVEDGPILGRDTVEWLMASKKVGHLITRWVEEDLGFAPDLGLYGCVR